MVTFFAYIIEKNSIAYFSEKIFSKPLDLELTPCDTIRLYQESNVPSVL